MTTLDFQFPYTSQRMPVLARNAVATSQPLAAQAGLRMLLKGGNAVDAILATAISVLCGLSLIVLSAARRAHGASARD